MNTLDMAQVLGLTEAEWLACENPVRLVKRIRDRSNGRRVTLLACAYALDLPQIRLRDLGREIVETVRELARSVPDSGWPVSDVRTRLNEAFNGRRTDGLPFFIPRGLDQGAMNMIGPGGRVVAEVVRIAYGPTSGWNGANGVSAAVEALVRREAYRETRDALRRVCRRPPACGPREAVLRMLPAEERAELAQVSWTGSETFVPGRILRRVQSIATKARLVSVRRTMTELVREVFGKPFRRPAIDPAWLVWNHGAVRHIAEQIDTSGAFGDLPVLADALEDAGCRDDPMLQHLRSEVTHYRGCWALDTVLGR